MSEELPEIYLENREDLINYLNSTEYEFSILKFTADWCGPCKKIDPFIEELIKNKESEFNSSIKKFIYIKVDVDECFDLYSFMKAKKRINGIPATFLYSKNVYMNIDEEQRYIPQVSITGTNERDLTKLISYIK